MDFSKAFDNVKHILLSEKLKTLPLDPFVTNWYLSFLRDRKQRVIFNGLVCELLIIRVPLKGLSGPYIFNVFINTLEIANSSSVHLAKYADDATLVVPIGNDESSGAVNEYMDWTYNTGVNYVCA